MEYQLGLWESLNVILVAESVLGTAFFVGIYLVLPIFLYRSVPPTRIHKAAIILLFMVIWGISLIPIWGSGWKINDDYLYIKAYFSSDNIKLSSMEIGFVEINSEWEPTLREVGAGVPGLSVGRYRLKNKKKALVFNHFHQNKLLLISADQKYYLIGHPGIENLYDALISLGAKEKSFE